MNLCVRREMVDCVANISILLHTLEHAVVAFVQLVSTNCQDAMLDF